MRPLDGSISANRFLRSPLPPGAAGFTHPKTNTVQVWFNLAAGTAGTHTAGASTLLYSTKAIEAFGGGWYRCAVEVTSTTITAITASSAPTAADNTSPANADEIYAGDAQFEAALHASSFITTTSATVTRSGDYLSMPLTGPWWNALEGAIAMEFLVTRRTPNTGAVFGGYGDTFANTAYLSRSANEMYQTSITATVAQAQLNRTLFTEVRSVSPQCSPRQAGTGLSRRVVVRRRTVASPAKPAASSMTERVNDFDTTGFEI